MPIKLLKQIKPNKVINIKKQVSKIKFSHSDIECSFVPIEQFSHIPSEEKKHGRYAQSTYSLGKFGKSSYVVIAYLQADFEKYRNDGLSNDEIMNYCVNFLNKTDEKKKGQRKDPKKPYGNLQLYGYRFINKFGKEVAAVELVTDLRTNENFWGTGNR